jgi:UDP-glucose 4-epimerase
VRILVVGGAGFIGSHLVDRLLAESHTVDVVDDLSSGSLANLASARAAGGELKIHHLDACAPEFGQLVALRQPEVIYHLGWAPPGRFGAATAARAVHSTMNVLDAAAANDVTKVVTALPGGALYGDVPARELPVKEGHAWEPVGAEGVIARSVADLHRVYRERHEVEFTALALANVYGSRQRADGGVVAAFVAAVEHGAAAVLHGDGRQARDFVFIDDVVDAFVRAGGRGSGLVVNVGTGVLTTVRELWVEIAGPGVSLPASAPLPADHASRVALSPTRARIHLAWAPWTSLTEGLAAIRRPDTSPGQ